MKILFASMAVTAVLTSMSTPAVYAAPPVEEYDPQMKSYSIRIGTVEMTKTGYLFRSEGTEKLYETSPLAPQTSLNGYPNGLPDLRRVGFRGDNGSLYEWGDDQVDTEYFKKFGTEHPHVTPVSLIFKGINGHRLEVMLQGKTDVCRVDIFVTNGPVMTLWRNLPMGINAKVEEAEAEQKRKTGEHDGTGLRKSN